MSSHDGVDPEMFFGDVRGSRRSDNKVLQLCKQVERAAATVLAGECSDEALLGASVAGVRPEPDASRLMVSVAIASGCSVREAQAALSRSATRFRSEVARSIFRKRVPELAFEVLVQGDFV